MLIRAVRDIHRPPAASRCHWRRIASPALKSPNEQALFYSSISGGLNSRGNFQSPAVPLRLSPENGRACKLYKWRTFCPPTFPLIPVPLIRLLDGSSARVTSMWIGQSLASYASYISGGQFGRPRFRRFSCVHEVYSGMDRLALPIMQMANPAPAVDRTQRAMRAI